MSKQSWPELLKSSKKTSLVKDGLRKVHYLFTDGREMAEEYDLQTSELVLRQWKHKTSLGAQGPWQIEVGEPRDLPTTVAAVLESEGIKENRVLNPTCSRKDTRTSFQWRIRNLPYPKEVFSVSAEPAGRRCVIRTSNKKYYKTLDIPDLDRCRLPLEPSALSFAHANNTLIVVYKKPREILTLEHELMKELKMLKGTGDGDVDCKTQ